MPDFPEQVFDKNSPYNVLREELERSVIEAAGDLFRRGLAEKITLPGPGFTVTIEVTKDER